MDFFVVTMQEISSLYRFVASGKSFASKLKVLAFASRKFVRDDNR